LCGAQLKGFGKSSRC